MLGLQPTIERIEKLVAKGMVSDLTYAALECRLAIERICYERIRIWHDYISIDDLKKWQPRDVVNVLIQEVDAMAVSTFTLSISQQPVEEGESLEFIAGDTRREWAKIGTQVGFEPKKLGELWNALSGVALHAKLPKDKEGDLQDYGDADKIAAKVSECLEELRRLSQGTLVGTGFGEEVSFTCTCGKKIKRKTDLLEDGRIISCPDPRCPESWRTELRDGEYFFERRKHAITCKKCGYDCFIPRNLIERLKRDQHLYVDCGGEGCDQRFVVVWRPMETQITQPRPSEI